MLDKICINLIGKLMNKNLSIENRNKLSIYIMDNLGSLPIKDIIFVNDQGQLVVGDKLIDLEKMKQLREHARIAIDNKAFALIREQVAFTAIANGIHKAETPEALLFNRAAIWYHQQLLNHLKILAQREETD